jgi:predicted nucleotidyltransferase
MSNFELQKLKELKSLFQKEGFIIDGVFGSYARGDNGKDSDIDILYHIESPYLEKYKDWDYFIRLDEIKREIEKFLKVKTDIADRETLNSVGKKYILKDLTLV